MRYTVSRGASIEQINAGKRVNVASIGYKIALIWRRQISPFSCDPHRVGKNATAAQVVQTEFISFPRHEQAVSCKRNPYPALKPDVCVLDLDVDLSMNTHEALEMLAKTQTHQVQSEKHALNRHALFGAHKRILPSCMHVQIRFTHTLHRARSNEPHFVFRLNTLAEI